jgi:UDP-glucuronate 4-epimerase
MRILVTGSAGFIGFHLVRRLLGEGHEVMGLDGHVTEDDRGLGRQRQQRLLGTPGYVDAELALEDGAAVAAAVGGFRAEIVVHLAARAGVRRSIAQAADYVAGNVGGTVNLLEALRAEPPRHFLFASSSSVYGDSPDVPFRETQRTDFPVSPYAATKKAGEVLTHAHAQLHGLPVTCFRFFTVYGPWGRPDMALFRFVDAIETGAPLELYGEGRLERDFTYIDDLVEAVRRLIDVPPRAGAPVAPGLAVDSLSPVAPWRSVNIAQGHPVGLVAFVEIIERRLGRPARRVLRPMQPGDVHATWANPALLRALTGYVPATPLETGVAAFVDWYRGWRGGEAI